jgi:type II restriction/modification system DNA methylase subunit YeeA
MNTKTFAQQSRNLLMDGVAKKLLYWGFDTKGKVLESPQQISGGYEFRGEVFNDPNVPQLWEALKKSVQHKGMETVVEKAAYTWFNRMMAIRIMAKNGYDQPQLEDALGLEHTPVLLQKARQGQYAYLNTTEQQRLKKIIGDYSKDQEVFALLLVSYCHNNTMLHRVFGKIDDYTELLLPDNILQDSGFLHLLNTTDAISDAEYKEVELIGWLYQFYISEKKDDVFASFKKGKKAEAKDIPAATQIFTPNWIVKYMVQNTAGKIWLDKHPDSPLKNQMKYLVVNGADNEAVSSSAQRIENKAIINNVEELTLIDPASGSGHILVEGFDLLYQMYMEEYYAPEEAVEAILKNNLYGLDIDDRATQLATFAILLKAATKYRDVFTKGWLPNVYAMPEDILQNWFTTKTYEKETDWLELQGMQLASPVTINWEENKKGKTVKKKATFKASDVLNEKTVDFLRNRYSAPIAVDYSRELDLFWGTSPKPYDFSDFFYAMKLLRQGKNLGSVIKCNINTDTRAHIEAAYNNWLEREKVAALDIEEIAILNTLKNYIPVLLILTKKYTAVVANPPYMGQKNMNAALKNYVNAKYPLSKSDLFAVFMEGCLALTIKKGLMGMINQQSWMFLSSYEKLRDHILNNNGIVNMLHLGPRTFEELSGEVVQSTAFIIENAKGEKNATYYRLIDYKSANEKEEKFLNKSNEYENISQAIYGKIPGKPLAYWASETVIDIFENNANLIKYAVPRQGMATGDNKKFLRSWAEVDANNIGFNFESQKKALTVSKKWFPYNKGGGYRKWYGNNEFLVNWGNAGNDIKKFKPKSVIRNESYYFLEGMTWTAISGGKFSGRHTEKGFMFDSKGPVLFPYNGKSHKNFMALLNSNVGNHILEILAPTLDFNQGPLSKFPYVKSEEELTEELITTAIKLAKKDWDSRETSWDFEQSPLLNETNSLEQAYTKWQEDVTNDFFQLHTNEEELNRIFIDIYGLQEELTTEVLLKDITILQEELNGKDLVSLEEDFRAHGKDVITLPIDKSEVMSQFISYAIGLFMGRYRLDKSGLNIAHPNPTAEELESYTHNNGNVIIDEDAIIPLMGKNCNFPDDAVQQFQELLDTIWGPDTRTDNVNFIQDCLDTSIEKFLVKIFYKYHCSMYKKKPIYWLFASPRGAFQVLVYMHRMNAFTVEKIRANYLLEHIKNLGSEKSVLLSNESNLSTEEAKRLDQLRKDITECETYDLILKDVADQQIVFDLDDGVTVNYERFKKIMAKIK